MAQVFNSADTLRALVELQLLQEVLTCCGWRHSELARGQTAGMLTLARAIERGLAEIEV